MQNEEHDNLEKFFQKALAQEDKTNLEKDWEAMERLLDSNRPNVAPWWSKKLSIIILCMTAFLAGYLIYPLTSNRTETFNKKSSNTEDDAALKNKSVQKDNTLDSEDNKISLQDRSKENDLLQKVRKNKIVISSERNRYNEKVNHLTLDASTSRHDMERSLQPDFLLRRNLPQLNSTPFSFEIHSPDSLFLQQEVTEVLKDDKLQAESFEKESLLSRFSISLRVAPDFTSTRMNQLSSPGTAYGATVGFQVMKRLAVTAGVISSKKKYTGSGEDYHLPYSYWAYKTNGKIPDKIHGSCDVLEIPVALRYDLLTRQSSNVFVSAGVSNYHISNENYDYVFYEPNPGASTNWSSTESTQYRWSVGHFSVGYERQVFRNLWIGAEPYIKLPFERMGWASINLYTTGVYFNLRYRFSTNLNSQKD